MKKISTIILVAALSGCMMLSLTACGGQQNTNNQSSESSVVSTSDTQSSVNTDQNSRTSTSESSESANSEQTEQSSTQSSGNTLNTQTSSDGSFDVSDISTVESSAEDSTFDISAPDDVSIVIDPVDESSIEPHGTVNPEYAGFYKFQMTLEDFGFETSDLDASTIEELQHSIDSMKMDLQLNPDGTAAVDMANEDEDPEHGEGTWLADGTTVFVTIDGATEQFTYNNGVLINEDMGIQLTRQ